MERKSYVLYWNDETNKTCRTAFEAKNDKCAINIANHLIPYHKMNFPQLYESEENSWYFRRVELD